MKYRDFNHICKQHKMPLQLTDHYHTSSRSNRGLVKRQWAGYTS